MDMPFNGTWMFGDKADSVLERLWKSRVTARSLGLSTAPRQPHSSFRPFRGYGRGYQMRPFQQGLNSQQAPQPFCGRGYGSHRPRGNQDQKSAQSARHPSGSCSLQAPLMCPLHLSSTFTLSAAV